jgi:uncharacterized membrane protein HdeD (DUF308 family)
MDATVARRFRPGVALPLLLALVVAGGLYAFGRNHSPDYGISLFGKTGVDTLDLKSWLGTGLLALAAAQVALALWMYGRLRMAAPAGVRLGHRLTGVGLLLLSAPIAYHCMFAYGVQTTSSRVLVHSLAGCFFYGAFVAKVTVVRSRGLPGWTLPLAGGTLALLVAVLWYTSSLWDFNNFSLPVL